MTDSLDKVRAIKQLPLFPLPVVLFPGTPLPLHIFEPRYQQMLKDIQISNNFFGIPFFDASESVEKRPPIGTIGCVAELRNEQKTEDGRSNILTVGIIRFRIEEYVETDDPYLVGEVSYFEDEEEDAELLEPRARAVRDLFLRVAKAVRELAGETAELPDLPDITPAQLSFFVAAAVDFDIKLKYEMLEIRLTRERLKRLYELLSQAVSQIEDRADIHKVAQTNGHSKKKIDLP
jgi:Lon protease-like protein